VMEPATAPRGAVVLLHGLTDSPYSLRHIAQRYREQGWLALAIRLPAHGTVPGALTDVAWQDWSAAARLALREARRRIGPSQPLHLVGYSNGGALAMKLALDALDDSRLPRAERIVLVSPMIGITGFARFAGVLGWPAVFPAFANTAWLNVLPEYNPFKYNSFPVNGARQSSLLTRALQAQIAERARDGRLAELPPVLSFQSIADYTVSTAALVNALYAQLPANGSELVVFDVNRGTHLSALLRSNTETAFDSLVGKAPRRYRASLVTNAAAEGDQVVERVTPALATSEQVRALGLAYPRELYSLSHVALPFPASDGLYGTQPSPQDDFGVQLGTMAARGEVGVLIVGLDTVFRASSNPFFEFMMQRVDAGIAASMARKPGG
jgi:alpha-beta hydrolase superfamily lysophospholipase